MTENPRDPQQILKDQFDIVARLSRLTGEYHRLLQVASGTAIERLHFDQHDGDNLDGLRAAEAAEAEAEAAAGACAAQVRALEDQLNALSRELARELAQAPLRPPSHDKES